MKNFRAQIGKAKKGWKTATVLVSESYPEWKVNALVWMQERYSGDSFPKDMMSQLKTWASANPDKKLIKFTMQFVSFVMKEVIDVGAVAMEIKLPFDQKAILIESEEYIKAQLKLETLDVENIDDEDAPTNVPDKVLQNVAPGRPYLWMR
jgi:leucyl-tRNA synthetase